MLNKKQRACQNVQRVLINYKTTSYDQDNKKVWGINTHFGE